MLRVALYGIHGLYNYGCEAIVRGAYQFLSDTFPGCHITYYSYRSSQDAAQISDIPITVTPLKENNSLARRGANKLLQKLGAEHRLPRFDYADVVDNNDIIVSIGGDIYTIPEYKRSQANYEYYSPLVQFGDYIKRRGKKLVIYGASIGPFGSYEKAVNYYQRHLNSADCIIAREQECVNYLSSIGIEDNVVFMPDPIFAIRFPNHTETRKNAIAINLSPLSMRELTGTSEDTENRMASLLVALQEATGAEIILVPHVLSHDIRDNDYEYLAKIVECLPERARDHFTLTKPESLFEANCILAQCKAAIAARMHCALNAAIAGTPPLFIAYSSKANGMAQLIYGTKEWVASLKDLDSVESKAIDLTSNAPTVAAMTTSNVEHWRKLYTSGQCSDQLRTILGINSLE